MSSPLVSLRLSSPIHRMLQFVQDCRSIALKPPGLIPVLMAGITNQSHTSLHWARCGIHLLLHMMFQQALANTVQLACENVLSVHFLYWIPSMVPSDSKLFGWVKIFWHIKRNRISFKKDMVVLLKVKLKNNTYGSISSMNLPRFELVCPPCSGGNWS